MKDNNSDIGTKRWLKHKKYDKYILHTKKNHTPHIRIIFSDRRKDTEV